MKQKIIWSSGLLLAAAILVACIAPITAEPSGQSPSEEGPQTLTAVKVDEVALDADADFWANAPKLTTPTLANREGLPDGPEVTLQAVYDDAYFALRAEWVDATESVLKNAWTWDGSAFSKSGDEDRLQIAFPMSNIPEFGSKGCAALCHNLDEDPEKWWMSTESADLRVDTWHWKSTRTNPVGQADDQYWHEQTDPSDVESGRSSDARDSGGYTDNITEDGSGPMFMHASDPTSIIIMASEEISVDTSSLAAGAVIPGYIISPFVGSRGDITAHGQWRDGKWVVVLMRALDTGHEDDVVFTPPKPYPFGLSITDENGGYEHTNAPEVLTLEWK